MKKFKCKICRAVFEVEDGVEAVCPICGVKGDKLEDITPAAEEAKPAPKTSENPFSDVKAGKYYTDAVLWAVEMGITSGTSSTTFSPKDNCIREQIVTFLYRAFVK